MRGRKHRLLKTVLLQDRHPDDYSKTHYDHYHNHTCYYDDKAHDYYYDIYNYNNYYYHDNNQSDYDYYDNHYDYAMRQFESL